MLAQLSGGGMQQFFEFTVNNWFLFLALVIVLTLLGMNMIRPKLLGFKEVKPAEVVQLINRDDAVLLDVRDNSDFEKGHILNAHHIPFGLVEERLHELEKFKTSPLVVYCETGQQSARAGAILQKQGFASVYKLSGGLSAWKSANFPLSVE